MDASQLQRPAEGGLLTFPPGRLADLLDWCQDHAENTGDARFSSIARALQPVAATFEIRDEGGGVDTDLTQELDLIIRRGLPGVLSAPSPAEGAGLAGLLRSEVADAMATSASNRGESDQG